MRIVGLAFLVAACSGPDPGLETLPSLDEEVYVRDVHPIFEARCGTLDCHGNGDRPLRMYAETGLRARDELRDQPITAEELAHNVEAASGVDTPAQVDDHLILAKALGRMKHSGDAVWASTDDPQYVCVRGWLAGQSDDPAVIDACALAATQVVIPPKEP